MLYYVCMVTSITDELLEQIKTDKEFIGFAEYGLGWQNYIRPSECKVFFGEDKISIYSIKPKLCLIKEIYNDDILNVCLDWSQKREKTEEGNSWFLRGLIGFLCFNFIGMAIGILSAKEPVYINVNVYRVKIKTKKGNVCLILDDLPKSGKVVL